MSLIVITYTPKGWSGGVNRWVNDLLACFPNAKHYCWWDCLASNPGLQNHNSSEWDRARVLNQYLIWSKKINRDDVILVDGFWGLGLESFPNVVSVAHGIWSHLTYDDVLAGKAPENPEHHRIQANYRRDHLARKGRIVAVSDFIADQLKLQWNWHVPVINNGIDMVKYKPVKKIKRDRKLVIHGVNDMSNTNKGWRHINQVRLFNVDKADVLTLDAACERYENLSKPEVLAQADCVAIPSGYEGNSYFCLETLACNVPIVAYDVGLPYKLLRDTRYRSDACFGVVLNRKNREDTGEFVMAVKSVLDQYDRSDFGECFGFNSREIVKDYSLENFNKNWISYLTGEFGGNIY